MISYAAVDDYDYDYGDVTLSCSSRVVEVAAETGPVVETVASVVAAHDCLSGDEWEATI